MTAVRPHITQNEHLRRDRKKLVIVGKECGKTSLLTVQSGQPFSPEYIPTIFENYISRISLSPTQTVELSLWDTSGQEDYDRLRPLSYPDTAVILIAFAVDARNTFVDIAERWNPEVNHFLPGVPKLLIGCRTDLRAVVEDPVSQEEGAKMATTIGALKYYETSAKTGEGVKELFIDAAKLAVKWQDPRRRHCKVL